MKRLLLFFLVSTFSTTGICQAATELFRIRNRPANELLPMVTSVLSPQGRAVADKVGNMIVVNDTEEVIEQVRNLLLSSDQRLPQVTVRMAFDGFTDDDATRFSSATDRPGRRLSTDRPHFGRAEGSSTRSSRSFLTLSSGSSGYIRMAKEVPFSQEWLHLCRRHAVPLPFKETRTLETGMEILPVASGDQVILTITPLISWMEEDRPKSYRFVDAATRVTLPRSQWIALGGMSTLTAEGNDVLGTIISTSDKSRKEGFIIRVMAEVKE